MTDPIHWLITKYSQSLTFLVAKVNQSACTKSLAFLFKSFHDDAESPPSWVIGDHSRWCYAPPFFYGAVCSSPIVVFGSREGRMSYSVSQVNNIGTLICCKARGCGPAYSTSCSGWGMYSIGCSTASIRATLPLGNNLAPPAIQEFH